MACICNDETVTQTNVCAHCAETFEDIMPPRLRSFRCPFHQYGPPEKMWKILCKSCQDQDYYIDSFSGQVKQACCTCNNEILETHTCEKCQQEYTQPLPHHLRVSRCPQHRGHIAICGPRRFICQDC